MKKYIFFISILFSLLPANDFLINPSFQGYTGVINTPNAQIIKEGHMQLHFNNQFDNSIIEYDYNRYYRYQEDYIVGFGLFSFMEIQGRLSEARGFHRDLSANVKFKIPYHHKYLPNIAFGIQDLGGEVDFYDNQYIVLDKEVWKLRMALGYGHSSSEFLHRKRMDGVFGSVEFQATPYLYFMAENDTKEDHIALRLKMPQSWSEFLNLRMTISRNITSSETSFGFTCDIPLYHNTEIEYIPKKRDISSKSKEIIVELADKNHTQLNNNQTINIPKFKNKCNSLNLTDKLEKFGFENIRITQKDDTIFLEIENSIFDYNDLDALGYLIGTLSFCEMNVTKYNVILLKNNIQTISISGDRNIFKKYIIDPSVENIIELKNNLQIQRDYNTTNLFTGKVENSSYFKPRLELAPAISTIIGNEQGIFHYVASLKAKGYMDLYKGLSASISYIMPVAESEEYREGGHFYNPERLKNKVTSAMLHQTLHYENILNIVSVGKYATNYKGIMNQFNFTSTDGIHGFNWLAGSFKHENGLSSYDKSYSLGSYRYLYQPLDFYTEFTYGKYWYGDIGYQINFKRFYGDVSVELYYKASHFAYQTTDTQLAGIAISFPITMRKLYNSKYMQLKGKKDFYYSIRTTVSTGLGVNPLNGVNALIPVPNFEIKSTYLNRDRLGSLYIKKHLDRLREAYIKYDNN